MDKETKDLLSEWGLDELTIDNFSKHKMTVNELQYLSGDTIDRLIPAIGNQIKFKLNLEKFLKKSKPDDAQLLDVKQLLENSDDGKDICNEYELEDVLTHDHRLKIIDIILNFVFDKKIKLSARKFDPIADQIVELFPNELKTEYYEPHRGYKPTGLLYERYYQRLKKPNQNKITPADELWNCMMEEGVSESYDYLKGGEDIEETDLLKHWAKTFKLRKLKIALSSSFQQTVHNWPHYLKPYGYKLISHDFLEDYGDQCSQSLKDNWDAFFESNFQVLVDNVRDIRARASLREIEHEEDSNFKNVTIALSLHYLVAPAKTASKSCTWTPGINDSKNSFFKLVTRTTIENEMKIRTKIRSLKDIPDHPMIFGIGATLREIEEFVVVVSETPLFHFQTFIEAVDVAFKLFVVFGIKFTPESVNFWIILNEVFYKVQKETKSAPKLKSILTNFNKVN